MSDVAFRSFKWAVRPFIGRGLGAIKPLGFVYQTMARRLIPQQEKVVEINGYKMKVRIESGRGIGGIAQKLIFDHEYEPYSTEIFKKLVGECQTVVDVGANIGYYTLLAAKLVGQGGHVMAFEPESRNYADLVDNVCLNEQNHIVEFKYMAASNVSSMAMFYLSKDEPGAHSLEACRDSFESVQVPTITIDEATRHLPVVDFMKIDTEGHEISVLQGADKTLHKCHNLMIECWEDGLVSAGHSIDKLLMIIREHGFNHIDIMDEWKKSLVPATACSIRTYSNKHKFSANLICWKGK